ncbi:4-alpha-L-fucosyltransferase [Oceanobacillus arenosus]|uniref:4-alpha-L-fucosyltransferase n=1 Tax=Oceanobacillus arenosus TaxID=1229153 RepID=A0A3D8Q1G8_9BACI|nr:TDP-N-acetylfucosamine:lipid II N-acetylfucosaminyltransferase [Oceanobacillus arenosus]RDW21448.1 4-alpha-L-fucosyltransferase [Oceanobacillus arenosus]
MKNLHILNNDKFTEPYINFVNKYFNLKQHQFAVIPTLNTVIESKSKNTKYFYSQPFDFILLLRYLNQADRIFLHSLFSPKIMVILFLQPWLLKKCYWIIWGKDLYDYNKARESIKAKSKEFLRAFIIKRFGHIVTLVKGDYDLAKKWYGVKGMYHHGAYITPISKKNLDTLPLSERKKEQLIIQIGNSADPTNNHLEALNKLARFREKNIIIYVPLSYAGNKTYVNLIIEEGKRIFGDKFIPLTEFLPSKEYSNYLNNIDIAIFNNDRQQALGNIYALLYLNKKVFIRSDTSMWLHFKEKFNIEMNDFLAIEKFNFNEFAYSTGVNNQKKITKVFSEDYFVSIWEPIFND